MTRAARALAVVALAACGTRTTELVVDGGPLPGLRALAVTPATTSLELTDLSSTLAVPLVATGTFESGDERDVTAEVTWSTDRPDAGAFPQPGRWLASNRGGGVITIEARSGEITGDARIELAARLSLDDPSFPPPLESRDAFAPPTPVVTGDPMHSPRVVYPASEVMLPLDLQPIVVQYEAGDRADLFRLRFHATYLDLDVYTTSDRWRADAQLWDLVTRTGAGEVVTLTVAGVAAAAPTTVWESRPVAVHVARAPAPGAIYYWTSATQGVVKGALPQAAATRFHPQAPDSTCTGCHALSRDGRRMAAGYGGERLQEISVPGRAVLLAPTRDAGWSTFSPDGQRLLVADRGRLTLLDADSGATVGPAAGVVDAGGLATHPDWSPGGDAVVVARCGRADDNRSVEHCGIVRIPYSAGAWGAPQVLVAAGPGDDNNYFPRHSPDGTWIAYVHANGKSKGQATAELRLIAAAGGEPATLARVNRRVGDADGLTGLANSMPAWAPSTTAGLDWLAFASTRDYGKLRVGLKPSQIWIAAIDRERADPGYAAFWLPLQDPAQRNHLPRWAVEPDDLARPTPPPPR